MARKTCTPRIFKVHTYLSIIFLCDSAFVIWNTLISLEEQTSNDVEREPSEDESDQASYMVQGNDSLEVILDSHLDDCTSTSNNDNDSMDAHMLNDELSKFCKDLL